MYRAGREPDWRDAGFSVPFAPSPQSLSPRRPLFRRVSTCRGGGEASRQSFAFNESRNRQPAAIPKRFDLDEFQQKHDTVTSGRVWFGDREITRFNSTELTRYRRDTVGFVFQFYNLVPNLTAAENVMVATELSRDPMNINDALKLVGLDERKGHFPSQLSGGEQQRVAIARAVAKNPALLLCDEPTGALDFATGKLVLRTLVDLNRQLGKTVVLITHNAAIAPVADRVIRMRSGQIVEAHTNPQPVPPEEIDW